MPHIRRNVLLFLLIPFTLTLPILGGALVRPGSATLPLVIAHRGGGVLAPENTLAALEAAIAAGADMVEVDVRSTRDGVLVALHDASLARTAGLDRALAEVDYPRLIPLDAGSWFSLRFGGEPVPTLEQCLAAARDRIPLMVEVKDQADAAAVVSLIRRVQMEAQCLLASTQLSALRTAREHCPTLETVYIGRHLPRDPATLDYVDSFSLSASTLTQSQAALVRGRGKKLYVWTVNTPSAIQRAVALGADGLVTDDPVLALEQLSLK